MRMSIGNGNRNRIPSYLQDNVDSVSINNGRMKIMGDHSLQLNNDTKRVPMEASYGGNAGKRIYDSTKQLKERNVGIDQILDEGLENNHFFEKFLTDLSDIETINNRVERDVQFRIQQRISKFGQDGKKILGIHIAVPVEHEKAPFDRLS